MADWTATDDDFGYMGEKRQRGGRKKRKKNRDDHVLPQNWDDIYDPSRPNNYDEYRNSDEKILEIREWKDRLYAHRMRRSPSRDSDSDDDYDRPMNSTLVSFVRCQTWEFLTSLQTVLLPRVALRRHRISTTCRLPLPTIHLGTMLLLVAPP